MATRWSGFAAGAAGALAVSKAIDEQGFFHLNNEVGELVRYDPVDLYGIQASAYVEGEEQQWSYCETRHVDELPGHYLVSRLLSGWLLCFLARRLHKPV